MKSSNYSSHVIKYATTLILHLCINSISFYNIFYFLNYNFEILCYSKKKFKIHILYINKI